MFNNVDNSGSNTSADGKVKINAVYKVILFWNQESAISEHSIAAQGSRKNVVVQHDRICFPDVPSDVQTAIAALDVYKDTLIQVLSRQQEFDEGFLKTVMLQVTRGVDHLHKCGKLFGKLTSEQVYISCCKSDEVSVVLRNPSADTLCLNDADEQNDIQGLENFFRELMTKSRISDSMELRGWSDNGVASHFIQMFNKPPISVQNILDHPFFWSDNEKIEFICESFDRVKHLEQKQEIIDEHSGEVFKNEWVSTLSLSLPERTEIQNTLYRNGKKKRQVSPKTIQDLATRGHKNCVSPFLFDNEDGLRKFNHDDIQDWKELGEKFKTMSTVPDEKLKQFADCEHVGPILLKTSKPLKKESLSDLLRFFRNRRAHYWDSKQHIRNCWSPYPEGFWRYFSSRFPRLLPFVFDNRDECFHNSA